MNDLNMLLSCFKEKMPGQKIQLRECGGRAEAAAVALKVGLRHEGRGGSHLPLVMVV